MPERAYSGGSTGLSDFKQVALLGEGAYSAVYKVLRVADNEVYALKKVKLPSLSDKEKQNALNEVRLLASVCHENVVAYKEAFWDDKTRCLCIVQECADAGDLLQQINRCKQERAYLREADVWRYLDGMCQGLKALHDLRILHRDLKCANVFLSHSRDGLIAKLGDFNVSKVAKRGLCMTQTGTPYYASPEVWRDMPYDAKSDMWSLGCVLYEMVALRPPFRAEDMEGLYHKVVRGQYPRIPAHYGQDLADVIAALLQVHPRNRPSVEQLLQMPQMLRHSSGLKEESRPAGDLLSTIKLPKNAIDLSGCLPKPRYVAPEEMPLLREDDLMSHRSQDRPEEASTGALGRPRERQKGSSGESQASRPPLPPRGPRERRPEPEVPTAAVTPAAPVAPSVAPSVERPGVDSLDAYLQQREKASDIDRAARAHPHHAHAVPHTHAAHAHERRRREEGSHGSHAPSRPLPPVDRGPHGHAYAAHMPARPPPARRPRHEVLEREKAEAGRRKRSIVRLF
ncbi:unnamed protein product [Durusdinium trenchii]|uniref:non-specific serine/threonine protein kinase n=1 Tax=Durusdinium trenchii TaxID=1381693 RepID=A0ABP0SVX4_9DINO